MPSPGQRPIADPLREKFAREYSRHGKGERAVIAAGFNVKTWAEGSNSACVKASNLLKEDKVLQRIQWLQENRARKADFTELQLIRELKRISFFDIRKLYTETGELKPVTEWDADTAAAVSGVEVEKLFQPDDETGRRAHVGYTVKVKTTDKVKAIEKLLQYFHMVEPPDDKANVTINDNRQVNYYLPENPRHAQPHRDQPEPAASAEPEPGPIQLPAKLNGSNGSH